MLLIDGDESHAVALKIAIIANSATLSDFDRVSTLVCGLEALAHKQVWAIFLNLYLSDSRGLETFDSLRLLIPATPIVVLGGANDEEICKTAMQRGAHDYLLEGHIDSYSFSGAIRNICERETARQELFVEKERAQALSILSVTQW